MGLTCGLAGHNWQERSDTEEENCGYDAEGAHETCTVYITWEECTRCGQTKNQSRSGGC